MKCSIEYLCFECFAPLPIFKLWFALCLIYLLHVCNDNSFNNLKIGKRVSFSKLIPSKF